MEAPWIEARGVAAGHSGRAVLRDVDLAIGAGEAWFLLGSNAQGKSTLLHTLLGILPPIAGAVRFGGPISRRTIGFVPQRCELAPNLPTTPHEFVSLGLVGLAESAREREARVAAALADVGLGELAHASYWSLSGGQRQRALVARALARRPRVYCVDEPMSHLDLVSERSLLELFGRVRREEGATTLFVTHDVAVAARYATHVALVHDGRVETGPRDAMLTPERLAVAFGAPVSVP